jgi:heme-degrading monooxygenase HmoA
MSVTLINVFVVPKDSEEDFLSNWKMTTQVFVKDAGFIEAHLHRNTGVGNSTFSFINIARWRSADAWRMAHDAYSPTEYRVPGVKGHPAIFEPIIDAVHEGLAPTAPGFLHASAAAAG